MSEGWKPIVPEDSTHHGTHVKRTESTKLPRKSIIIGTQGREVRR
jgi:hypothetical protein